MVLLSMRLRQLDVNMPAYTIPEIQLKPENYKCLFNQAPGSLNSGLGISLRLKKGKVYHVRIC